MSWTIIILEVVLRNEIDSSINVNWHRWKSDIIADVQKSNLKVFMIIKEAPHL